MSSGQLLKEMNAEVLVDGKGNNLDEAIQDIFKKIHHQVYKEIENPIIQMETKEVYFDEVKRYEKKSLLSLKPTQEVVVESRVLLFIKYLDIKEEKI